MHPRGHDSSPFELASLALIALCLSSGHCPWSCCSQFPFNPGSKFYLLWSQVTRSVTFVNIFLSLHFSAEFCIILALSFDMKNGASDASWIGTITSILFTNAKTVTNYTYVLLLRVSVSVALLNSFKSMYLRPRFNGSRQIFQRTKLARIDLSGFRDTRNHASFWSAKRAKFCSRISTVQSKQVAQVKFIRSKIFPDQGKLGLPI